VGEPLGVEGSGGPWYSRGLVILGGQRAVLELLLVVVRLGRRLDVHEGDGGTHSRPFVILGPRQKLDTLHSPIPADRHSSLVMLVNKPQ
jgi:hypothetical protein